MPRHPSHTVDENKILMKEWNYSKNDSLGFSPEMLGLNSHHKVWWHCSHGHEWDMSPAQRSRGQGCPFCSGNRVLAGFNDLATTAPEILQFWDFTKNELNPTEVSKGSHKKVWWTCENGHSYQMPINKKTSRSRNTCPVCSGHVIIPGVNDFGSLYPELAKEWHPTKNMELKPSDISKQSGKRVWWKCQYGHEWMASPHDRVGSGTGCPICAKRRLTSFPEQAIYYYVKKLYPSAQNRYKEIADNGMELDIFIPDIRVAIEYDGEAWHRGEDAHKKESEKYAICRAENIRLIRVKEAGDNRWRDVSDCTFYIKKKNREDLSNTIRAILGSIDKESNRWTRMDSNCFNSSISVDLDRDENAIREYLTPIPNSLAELRPDLVGEWNYEKNGTLLPEMFGINSNDRVWWRCKKCGHEWKTAIIHRGGKRNSGCPECAKAIKGVSFTKRCVGERGSLADNNPALAAEWHPTKNGTLKPSDITEKRFKPVWWLCPVCGYEWESSPNSRARQVGCPCCSGRVPKIGENDIKTLYPDLVEEWDYERNGDLLPEQFLPNSGKKVWWKCKVCNQSWEATISNRTKGSGCPFCSGHRATPGKNDLKTLYREIAAEWDYEKNGELLPEQFLPKSAKKVWWKCQKCGYSWQAVIHSRTRGSKCVKCRQKAQHEKQ